MPIRSKKLCFDTLEERWNPANLTITNLLLVDGNNSPIAATPLGEQTTLRAEWTVTGVPAGTQYLVRFTFDGVTFDSAPITQDSQTNMSVWRPTWFATAGNHAVTAKVDGANSVAETDESDADNKRTLNFTTGPAVGPATKWVYPISDKPTKNTAISDYADADPHSGAAVDYTTGPFTVDGYDSDDIGVTNFSFQDAGVPTFAVAPGVVEQVIDGNTDRETSYAGSPTNLVIIDHQNGWKTWYWHLATNSITVKAGDTVTAGQLIGLMGSSGNSTGANLQFQAYHNGALVEPMFDAAKFFIDPPLYQTALEPYVAASGITNYDIYGGGGVPDAAEMPSGVSTFKVGSGDPVYFWFGVSHFKSTNSMVDVDFIRPDGSIGVNYTPFASGSLRGNIYYFYAGMGNFNSYPGEWEAVVTIDGVLKAHSYFTITSGTAPPEIRVQQGGTRIILNDRTTPIDFGTVAKNSSPPTQSFRIGNHGYSTLTLGNLVLPPGFSLVGSFPTALSNGFYIDFTVQMDTTVAGDKFGALKFNTNDDDESVYSFLLKGTVTGLVDAGSPVLALPGPAIPFMMGDGAHFFDKTSTFADSDDSNYNGGSLKYEIIQGSSVADRIGIFNEGTGAGQIGVNGANFTYGGVVIGSFAGGTGSTPLDIGFNNNSSPSAIQALMRQITYHNVNTVADTRPRFVRVTAVDPSGVAGNVGVKRITLAIDRINDAPVVNAASVFMAQVLEDSIDPPGQQIGAWASAGSTDPDGFDPYGIAVTGMTNADGGTWQYSLDNGAVWKTFGTVGNNAALLLRATDFVRFMPNANANGTATLLYHAWDQSTGVYGTKVNLTLAGATGGKTAFSVGTQTAKLVITPVDDAPSFIAGSNQASTEDAGPQSVSNWATSIDAGPNESGQVVSFEVTDNTNSALFSAGPAVDSTGKLTYTPAPNANGIATITLRALDDGGTSYGGVNTSPTQTFDITISAINDAPSFTRGASQRFMGTPTAQAVSNWATNISPGPADEAGQSVSFEIVGNTDPGLFDVQPLVSPTGTLTYTPAANVHGYSTITLRITDTGGTANGGVDTSATQSFAIGVNPINAAPSFIVGSDPTVSEDAGLVTLPNWGTNIDAGSAFEADQSLSFDIVSNSNPSLFSTPPSVDAAGTLQFQAGPDLSGSATLQVRLHDNGGTAFGGIDVSPTQSFTINVLAVNDAPSFTKGANQRFMGTSTAQAVSNWATNISPGPADEAGQSVSFEIVGNSDPSLFDVQPLVSPTGTLTCTPAPNVHGYSTITLRITDTGGTVNGGVDTSATQSFAIGVNPINAAPSFIVGSDPTVPEDAALITLANWATNIDAGSAFEADQTLAFEIVSNSNLGLFSIAPSIDAAGTLQFQAGPDLSGSATLQVRLHDNGGTNFGGIDVSTTQSFTINVLAVNDAPVLDNSFTPLLPALTLAKGEVNSGTSVSSLVKHVTDVDTT
ncbi:MAG TPA: Ig-like domain-containing protein, partial [Gemmataceae bacterium]|nr:Ig-like domain-containing protein [Gemmataceae bacterium]